MKYTLWFLFACILFTGCERQNEIGKEMLEIKALQKELRNTFADIDSLMKVEIYEYKKHNHIIDSIINANQ